MKAGFIRRGGLWVLAQFALMAAVLLSPLLAQHQWPALFSNIMGGLLCAGGAVLGIAGARTLGRNRTAFPAPHENAVLVRTGVYRLVRHPLYGSLMLLSLGWSLLWQSYPALGSAVLLMLLLTLKAGVEDKFLRSHYRDYDEYARNVRRFIPGLW